MAKILRQWRILVVEDDNFLATAYKKKLEIAGYKVKVASDGEEAFNDYQKFAPELVILDLKMPKIDGFGFLESLQKNGIRGNTPIIVATNSGEKGDIEKAVSMGANDYVVKSDMSMKGLIEKIEKHLAIAQKNAQANPQVQTGS